MEGFVVRHALPNDLKSTFLDLSIKEGWRIGKYDVDFFYDVDNTGFYIGELDGVPVSCISVVKYDQFAFLGFYVVAKEHRGQGIGLKTFQTAMASLDGNDYTCGLYCLDEMIPTYERSGFFVSTSLIKTYETTPSVALQGLLQQSMTSHVIIKPINEVSFDKVSQYDSFVFGAPHDKYLKGLLSTPEQYGFVALDEEQGNIVGLIVVRKALLDDGWIIAPLFANTSNVAKSLLKTIFEVMIKTNDNDKVTIDMEIGFNPHCTEVTRCLVGKLLPFNVTTMYTKGPPVNMKKEFIYTITSLAVG